MIDNPVIVHIVTGTVDGKLMTLGVFDSDSAAGRLVVDWRLRSDDVKADAWLVNGLAEEESPQRLLVKPIYTPEDIVVIDDGDIRGLGVVLSCDGDVSLGAGLALYRIDMQGYIVHMLGKDIVGSVHKIE